MKKLIRSMCSLIINNKKKYLISGKKEFGDAD